MFNYIDYITYTIVLYLGRSSCDLITLLYHFGPYIKLKAICLLVHPSVCTFWYADISAVAAWIEMGLARNESCVFEDHKVYFYKPIVPTVHRQECLEAEGFFL